MCRRVRYSLVILILGLSFGLAGVALGQDSASRCPKWFPDLSPDCERPARYAGFTAPMSAWIHFEEPFINTGVSIWGLWHEFPDTSVFAGGDVHAIAVQARVAVTDRLALIATKDGHIHMRPGLSLLDDEKGYGDLGFGFKYALIERPEERLIVTPSLRYEMTQGSGDVLQGNGEGVWIPAISFGSGLGEWHLLGSLGARLPVDGDEESSILFYSAQTGFSLGERLRPFVGVNGLHYMDGGNGSTTIGTSLGPLSVEAVQTALGTGRFEGVDVANLGSRDVEGHDYLTAAAGFRIALWKGIDLGVSYERPITKRRYITKQRVQLNILIEL